jgi:hypothetical protein
MEVPEMWLNSYQNAWCHIPEKLFFINKLGQAIHTSAKEIQQKEERPKK